MEKNMSPDRLSTILNEEDFINAPSLKSENEVRSLVEKINNDVATSLTNIGEEIKNQLYEQEKQFIDVHSIDFYLGITESEILQIIRNIKQVKENQDITDTIYTSLKRMNLNLSKENLFIFKTNVQYLKLIRDSTHQETIDSLKWIKALSDVVTYLNNSATWYYFLRRLYDTLSKYETQKNVKLFETVKENLKSDIKAKLDDKGKVKISEISLKEFLDEVIQQDSHGEYLSIKHVELDEPKLKSLHKILDFTLEDNAVISCNNATRGLMAQGKYIKLSDITDESCPFRPKLIELHASDKVFIDANLNKTGEKVQLFIISPTWDIVGSPKIILDGKSGDIHDIVKARDGVGPGQDGNDGKAGKPGGSAGHFIGIGLNFINGKNLEIYANGGNGGPGQNGGDGISGKDAERPPVPQGSFDCNKDACEEYTKMYNFPCRWEKTTKIFDNIIYDKPVIVTQHTFILAGKEPSENQKVGGSGGHGGSPGKGGNAGKIILPELKKSSEIKLYNDAGKEGKKGIGGSSQQGGLAAIFIHVSCNGYAKRWTTEIVFDNGLRYNYGINGKDGYSDKDLKDPEILKLVNPSLSVNKYKNYFRENFRSSIRQTDSDVFLKQLEKNDNVTELYDTLGLVDDFNKIEDQFYNLRSEFSFVPVYKSLLRRINEYIEQKLSKYVDKVSLAEDKKILDYLYAAALSRICRINNEFEDSLVVNLKDFIDETIAEIDKLEKLESTVTIDKYQRQFEEVVSASTKEAETYIETQLTPEVDRIINNIEDQIELLIEEIIKLENEGIKKQQQLIEEQQKLKDALLLRLVLNSLKVIGVFLSFIGPLGAAAGALIGGGATLAETYILDNTDSDGSGKIPPLPASLKNSLTKITDQDKEEQRLLSQQITDIEIKLKDFSDEEPTGSIAKIKEQAKVIEDKLNQLKKRTDSATTETVRYLRNEMSELLENEKKILVDRKKRNEPKIDDKITFVNYAQNVVSLADVSLEFYSKISQDNAKISKVAKSIQEANQEINLIIELENEIYSNLVPRWKNLEHTVATIEDKIKNKSQVVLEINKWKIQDTLKDVKFQIQQITTGFKSHDGLMHYLEKLENSMTFMINLYDRLEYYHDKKELASYIANIIKGKTVIDDKDKNDAVNKLKLAIQSNLVLEKYEMAMNAIRQYVFPFGDFYLSEYDFQKFINLNDTESLRSHAKMLITNLRSKMTMTSATTNNYDQYIANNAQFNRRDNRNSTLFVWKHTTSGHIISKLLEGEEITVKADITQGLNRDAIKFNDVGLRFVLANKTQQHELRKQLDHFKLRMTHLGNNYYKCGDKIYLILNKSHTVSYEIAKDGEGKHLQTFLDYDKIHDNCPLFSPYASWKIQLTNISASFNELAQYKSEPIDLQLVGRGKYIEEGSGACKANLNKYYTQIGSISRITPIKSDNDEVSQENDDTLDDIGISKICSASDGHRLGRSLIVDEILRQNNKMNVSFTTKDYNIPESSFIKNSELPEVPQILNGFPHDETYTTANNIINNSSLYSTNNLLLLDLLIRQKNGIKYSQKNNIKLRDNSNIELAQTLAYRGHLHK